MAFAASSCDPGDLASSFHEANIVFSQPHGTLKGAFAVTPDGAATYSLPLIVPDGRAGIQPSLSLDYSSAGGNGPLGVGWSVSGLSQITRCGSTTGRDGLNAPVKYTAGDHYCLDGARLVVINGTEGGDRSEYRTEPDGAARIIAYDTTGAIAGPETFVVYAKDTRILTYARVIDGGGVMWSSSTASENHHLTWLLSKIEDREGNSIDFVYGSTGERTQEVEWWIDHIAYTGHPSGAPANRRVTFQYDTVQRTDVMNAWHLGTRVWTRKRLKKIVMEAPTTPGATSRQAFRTYLLTYEYGNSGRSRVTQIALCDWNTACLPPLKFTYSNAAPVFVKSQEDYVGFGPNWFRALDGDETGYAFGDVDGDLRTDLLFRQGAVWYLRKGKGDGTLDAPVQQLATTSLPPNDGRPANPSRLMQLADVDLDGDDELITVLAPVSDPNLRQLKIFRRVSDSAPQWQEAFALPNPDALGAGGARTRRLADMNGDGLLDDVKWIKQPGNVDFPLKGAYHVRAQTAPGTWSPEERPLPTMNEGYFGAFFDSDGDGQIELHRDGFTDQIRGANVESRASSRKPHDSCDVPIDYNGDGLIDKVRIDIGTWTAYPNTGDGRLVQIDGSAAVSAVCGPNMQGYDPGFRVVDYNQDGLHDIIILHPSFGSANFASTTTVLLSTGTGFVTFMAPITSNVPECQSITSEPCPKPFAPGRPFFDASLNNVVDVNGDGRFDVITTYSTNNRDPETAIRFMLWTQSSDRGDLLQQIEDGNGALVRRVAYAPLNDTALTGYTRPTGCAFPIVCHLGTELVVTTESIPSAASSGASPSPAAAAPLLAYRHTYEGGRRDVKLGWLGFASHKVVDQRAGQGSHTVVTVYDQTSAEVGGLRRYPNRGRPKLVTETVNALPEGRIETSVSYKYTLKWATQPNGAITFFSFPSEQTLVEARSGPVAPIVLRQFTTTTALDDVDQYGNVLKTVTDLGGGRKRETVTVFVPPDLTLPASAGERKGWLIEKPDHVTVTAYAPPVESGDPPTMQRGVSYSYANNEGAPWRVKDVRRDGDATQQLCTRVSLYDSFGQPQLIDVTPGTCLPGSTSRSTSVSYDGDGVYPATVTQYGDSINLTNNLSIDPRFGVPGATTDENGLVTEYTYDGFGRVRRVDARVGRPDTTWQTIDYLAPSNGFGVAEKILRSDATYATLYHDRLGQPVRHVESGFLGTDVITDTEYDAFGRLLNAYRPRFSADAAFFAARYSYDEANRITAVCQHDAAKCVKTSYNGLVTKSSEEDDSTTSEVIRQRQIKHTPFGAIEKSTYWSDGIARDTTYSYGHFETLRKVVDPLGNVVKMRVDAYGRRVRLDDEDVGYVETTYSAFDEVLTETIPATTGETIPSVTTLRYDKLGRILSRLSADGEDVFVYDVAPGAGKAALATRTRRTNGTVAGQISSDISTSFEYTASGFLSKEKWTIDAETYEFGYTYDQQGRPLDTIYPQFPLNTAPLKIQNVWNRYGHIGAVRVVGTTACTTTAQCPTGSLCSGGSCYIPGNAAGDPHDLVSNAGVDAEFRVTKEQVPSLAINRQFDGPTGRLKALSADSIFGSSQSVTYDYEPHGNLKLRTSVIFPYLTESFTYDDANRLKTASLSGGASQAFFYDAIGNMTTSSTGGASCTWTSGEGAAGPHALTSGTCCADVTRYDARGNVTYEGCKTRNTVTYSSFNKPTSVQTTAGPREFFSYDAEHTRIRKRAASGRPQGLAWNEVITPNRLFERRKGDTTDDWVYYVYANGRVVGQLTQSKQGSGWGPNNGWQFLFQDRLGSVELATTDRGVAVSRTSFGSWGARRNADGTSEGAPSSIPPLMKRGFTGHSHDDEFAWVDMGGRQYNPYTRRFLQADPFVSDPTYGPSWNRYSYARNNPHRYTDPSGYRDNPMADEMTFQWWNAWVGLRMNVAWVVPINYWDYNVFISGPRYLPKAGPSSVPPALRTTGSQVVSQNDAPPSKGFGVHAPLFGLMGPPSPVPTIQGLPGPLAVNAATGVAAAESTAAVAAAEATGAGFGTFVSGFVSFTMPALGAAGVGGMIHVGTTRAASLVRYGTPFSAPAEEVALPLLGRLRTTPAGPVGTSSDKGRRRSGKDFDLALGLRTHHSNRMGLDEWAHARGLRTYWDFYPEPQNISSFVLGLRLLRLIASARSIHFRLNGMTDFSTLQQIYDAGKTDGIELGNVSNWEFYITQTMFESKTRLYSNIEGIIEAWRRRER